MQITTLLIVVQLAVDEAAATRPWPYYVPRDVHPPTVENADWVINDVDRFVLCKLEERGLRPAPAASKRTLVRRLFFDLIGLPPMPEDVETYLNDAAPDAYSRLVDRLLDDPRYLHAGRFRQLTDIGGSVLDGVIA
ncbi:MAG: DUF1549 domain-containing protein [Pirellulaceae bacterium]|nr:DUF1549 domain-containing protein [Planctomycetales bacterium]